MSLQQSEMALAAILATIDLARSESDDHEAIRVVEDIARRALGLPPATEKRYSAHRFGYDADGYYLGDHQPKGSW